MGMTFFSGATIEASLMFGNLIMAIIQDHDFGMTSIKIKLINAILQNDGNK